VERDVVRRVPGGVDHVERPAADRDAVAARDRTEPVRVARKRLAVEGAHPRLAVGPRGAGDQPAGVHQVRRASFVDPDACPGEPVEEGARRAGVIDVDVRHDDVREIGIADPERLECRDHDGTIGAGTGLDERGLVAGEQVDGVQLPLPGHARVDLADAVGDDRIGVEGLHLRESGRGVGGGG
jgi:hypothetical protein